MMYEVSYDTYKGIIEPMYTALPAGISKTKFISMLDKKAFALPTKSEMKKAMRKEAMHLFEICGHHSDYTSESILEKLAHDYAKRYYGLDWVKDTKVYCYFIKEYEYPEIKRGCTYPKELVIGRDNDNGYGFVEYERIQLVK